MIKFNNLKFIIFYYKFLDNKSTLIFNNNIKINVPLILKTNKSRTYLYFFYNTNNIKSKLNYTNMYIGYKKLYTNLLLNILYSLNKQYLITLRLIDKNKDGYKVLFKNDILTFKLGKSHDLNYILSKNFFIKLGRKAKSIKIYSSNLQELIDFVLKIRKHRLPEPYKGKGVIYKYEKIKLKKIRKLRSIKNFKKKRKK